MVEQKRVLSAPENACAVFKYSILGTLGLSQDG